MTPVYRPHVLGVDDGPFDKRFDADVPIVGVMMEGADLVESVAVTRFALDGEAATEFLADWIAGMRCASALHAVVLGGITIAGLGIIDVGLLAGRLGRPVIVVNRHEPTDATLIGALRAAGMPERIAIVERTPAAWKMDAGLFVSHSEASPEAVRRIVSAIRNKSRLPEPLRLAHLIGSALVGGESRGRP